VRTLHRLLGARRAARTGRRAGDRPPAQPDLRHVSGGPPPGAQHHRAPLRPALAGDRLRGGPRRGGLGGVAPGSQGHLFTAAWKSCPHCERAPAAATPPPASP
jgi:hypothetical protein